MSASVTFGGLAPALVIVDVQEAAVAARPFEVERVIRNIAALLSAARDSGTAVVFVQHDGKPGEAEEPHTPGWEIHTRVAPRSGEPIFRKRFNSAFRETGLHSYLRARGVEALVIVGIQTEYCVDTTIRVAFELGYSVVVPEMTNTTFDNGSLPARDIYELFNHRIFADRFGSVVPVEDVLESLDGASIRGPGVDQASFYDDIAEYYDLIYPDWEESMRRHALAISTLLGRDLRDARILDVSAGIGTQSLPLAAMGYEVVARDLSRGAIRRLEREAEKRGLRIDAARADMREVGESVSGVFDAVISFDNSVPHLLSDDDIAATLRGLVNLLAPGGVLLISVRDYGKVDRSPTSVHRYGERVRGGSRYRMSQEWSWYDESHYRTTMTVDQEGEGGWREVVRTAAAYYAIPIPRLLGLMGQAGLDAHVVEELRFFQPVLRGRLSDKGLPPMEWAHRPGASGVTSRLSPRGSP